MTVVQATAIVMAVVQFAKKLFPTVIQGVVAIVLVILSSICVTAYKYLSEGIPFGFDAVIFLVEVVVAAMSAYSLIKVAGGNGTPA